MTEASLPLDQIIQGDSLEVLKTLPEKSIDLIFADPPYNLQLQNDLWRPNMTLVDAVNEEWDHFESLQAYDEFSRNWLSACKRVLKDNGSLWVIGTYHNIYRIGSIMQDLGFWFLNDVVWIKTNPMPNFRGVRFTNAHETLLWASKSQKAHYTFNHHAMKSLNDDLQMRSDWLLPICSGKERLRENGKRVHATQKPQALLYRVILSSSNPGDVVLDPFFGSGTTGAVAKKLHRHWIGIEGREDYIAVAQRRLDAIQPDPYDDNTYDVHGGKKKLPRIAVGSLLEAGYLNPGQALYFRQNLAISARLRADGKISFDTMIGSIHAVGSFLSKGSPCNGWEHWYYQDEDGTLHPLDELRHKWVELCARSPEDTELENVD
ncbi:MAG: DNA methyltransferase [Anaerolineaceae bacterium]